MKTRMRAIGLPLTVLLAIAVVFFATSVSSQTPAGASKDQISRGEYLVVAGGCTDCHTPKLFTQKGPVPDDSKFLAGTPSGSKVPAIPPGVISPGGWGAFSTGDSTIWAGPWGISFAANLTPDKATGLGSWT